MSTTTQKPTRLRGGRRLSDGRVLYWWVEVLAILAFYLIYSAIRNANQSGALTFVSTNLTERLPSRSGYCLYMKC